VTAKIIFDLALYVAGPLWIANAGSGLP